MELFSYKKKKSRSLAFEENVLFEIDFDGDYERSITDKFGENPDNNKELLKLLKEFNRHIVEVDASVQQYVLSFKDKKKRLGFSRFSTSERLFVLCFMAHTIEKKVVVCREIAELDLKRYKLFFKLFAESDYIDIICPNDYILDLLMDIYEEAKEGHYNDIFPNITID